MRPIGAERIYRSVEFVLDRAGRGLPAHIVDRAADRGEARHQRQGSLHEFDLLKIGRIQDARGDALRANPNAVVEHGHLAKGKTAHGKAGGRPGDIDCQHADSARYRLRRGAVALLAHGLLTDNFNCCRRLKDGEAE